MYFICGEYLYDLFGVFWSWLAEILLNGYIPDAIEASPFAARGGDLDWEFSGVVKVLRELNSMLL